MITRNKLGFGGRVNLLEQSAKNVEKSEFLLVERGRQGKVKSVRKVLENVRKSKEKISI